MKVFTNFIPDEGVEYVNASEYTIVLQRHEFEAIRTALGVASGGDPESNPEVPVICDMLSCMEGW